MYSKNWGYQEFINDLEKIFHTPASASRKREK